MGPRTPSFDSMPDIAAGPGFRGVRCSAFLAFAQHPFHPERAGPVSRGTADPCYPTRSLPPLQAKAERRKDASHRTLQPTFSTGTGRTARFLPPGALHSASDEVETSVDAASPASGLLSTLARGGTAKRGAPHRSGTALQRRSRPRTALEARPSDARVPIRPLSPTGRAVSVVPPSRDTPSSAQGAFPRQVLPASLARRRTPATVPGALPPPDRLPAPRRSSLALGKAGPAASSEAHTPAPGRSGAPVDFCNHHGSPARSRIDRPPRASPGVTSMAATGSRALETSVHDRPSVFRARGHRGRERPRQRLPTAIARWGALPRPDRLGHLLSRVRACAGRRAGSRLQG